MIFSFEHGMSVRLGVGWDPQRPMSNIIIRGGYENSDGQIETPIATDTFKQSFVNDFHEYQEHISYAMNSSGKGSVGVFKASGSASFSREREIFRNSRNIVWMISCQRKYEAATATEVFLSDKGKQILSGVNNNDDQTEIVKKLGSHIVTSISKVAEIHLVYVFTVSNSKLVDKVKSAITANASVSMAEGEGKITFQRSIQEIDSSVKIEYDVKQVGLSDSSESILKIIEAAPGNLSHVRSVLKKAVENIEWSRSRIYEFTAEPLSSIFDIPELEYDIEIMTNRISRLNSIQRKVVKRYYDLQDILDRADLYDIELKEGAIQEIKAEMSKLDNHIESVEAIIKKLRNDPDSFEGYPDFELNSKKLNWLNLDFGKFNQWKYSVTGNKYNWDARRIHGTVTFWPSLKLDNIEYIKHLEIYRNGVVILSLSYNELINYVNNSIFETQSIWSIPYNLNIDCRPERVDEECNPKANNIKYLVNNVKGNESSFVYKCVVTDIENAKKTFDFGNVATQPIS